ncbi:hypothetical protein HY449_04585 [Candidatus Pacearchaeota archaeon]|nr:hypothetical protein [Candidatus Pacearchaeota archaeon]
MAGDFRTNRILNHSNSFQRTYHPTEKSPLNLPLIMIGVAVVFVTFLSIFLFTLQNENFAQQEDNSKPLVGGQLERTSGGLIVDENCDVFLDKLDSCTRYKCQLTHPFTRETLLREILGMTRDGKCSYAEEMPNNGKMECKYTESIRKAMVQFYEDLSNAESTGASTHASLSPQGAEVETKYTIDGKEVENPLQEALDNGQCVISGYG